MEKKTPASNMSMQNSGESGTGTSKGFAQLLGLTSVVKSSDASTQRQQVKKSIQPVQSAVKSVIPIPLWQNLLSKVKVSLPTGEAQVEPSTPSTDIILEEVAPNPLAAPSDEVPLVALLAKAEHNYSQDDNPKIGRHILDNIEIVNLETGRPVRRKRGHNPKVCQLICCTGILEDPVKKPKVPQPRQPREPGARLNRVNKRCCIPPCRSNDRDSPNTVFFSLSRVPVVRQELLLRLKWTKKNFEEFSFEASKFVCHLHYVPEEDMVDVNAKPWRLKEGVLPRKIKSKVVDGKQVWIGFDEKLMQQPVRTLLLGPTWRDSDSSDEALPYVRPKPPKRPSPPSSPEPPKKEKIVPLAEESEIESSPTVTSDSEFIRSDMTWHGLSEEEEFRLANEAAEKGKTMRTRRDGPVRMRLLTSFKNRNPYRRIPQKTEKCEYCPEMWTSRCAVIKHMRTVHEDLFKNFECTQCSRKYTNYRSYTRHLAYHSTMNARPDYSCKSCGKKFAKNETLQRHRAAKHAAGHSDDMGESAPNIEEMDNTAESQGISCPKCSEVLESDKHLVVHMVNHGLTYKCDYCPETIQEWPNIYQHMLTHLGPGYEGNIDCGILSKV